MVGIGEAFVEGVVVESRVADEAVFVDSVGIVLDWPVVLWLKIGK